MSKGDIEARVIDKFRKLDKKNNKKINLKHKKLEIMKKHNYKARTSQAYGFSEKAEVETLFLASIEEIKNDLVKK